LKEEKKASPTVVNHVDNLNDHSGKLVNCQCQLKEAKKLSPTVVILLVSNDHSGKLVNCQLRLK